MCFLADDLQKFGQWRAEYTYHLDRSAAARRLIDELSADFRYRDALRQKEAEHERMTAISRSDDTIKRYLDAAPAGMGYAAMAKRMRR
jgi:hypothetical protein